jgi:ABC-type transport system substrate-binding protein
MELERKNIAIIVLAVALVGSGIGNVLLGIIISNPSPPSYVSTFIMGYGESPAVLDPIDSWDAASNDVISQVAETLFWYDLRDSDLPLKPLLAESFSWDESNIELTIILRENIYFHDGTKLDANAIKWNMDRILYFTNATGSLPAITSPAFPSSLYFMPDGSQSIINSTVVNGPFNLTIKLNNPFGPFVPLLAYTSSSIISPASHSNTSYIDLTSDKLIGTGPYMFDYYRTNIEVRFSRWNRYWRTGAFFEKLVFNLIDDDVTRNLAMLGHGVDMINGADDAMLDQFELDPNIHVEEIGPDLIYWYMAFNTQKVNVSWRKAISHAYNYSYIIDEIKQGNAVRSAPAVPVGMPGHNASVQVAQYDIPLARQILQSMGFGVGWDVGSMIGDAFTGGAHESNWASATFYSDVSGAPLEVNYHSGSITNRRLNDLLFFDLNRIGIDTVEVVREWSQFLDAGEQGLLDGLWYVGWGPDYLEAFNMLDPLFNKYSASNFVQLNDTIVQGWLEAAAAEANTTLRYELYGNLQYRLFEVLYVHMALFANLGRQVHGIDIKDYPYNVLNNFYIWPAYRET